MLKNKEPLYVYCSCCKELIAKCYDLQIAQMIIKTHQEQKIDKDNMCLLLAGKRKYFEDNFPQLNIGSNKVIFRINSGIAELIEKPLGIEVEMRDYDNLENWDQDDKVSKRDWYGNIYQETLWETVVELLG